MKRLRIFWALLSMPMIGLVTGCGTESPDFRVNNVYMEKISRELDVKFAGQRQEDVYTALTAMFGTPDLPVVTGGEDAGVSDVLSVENLHLAAGPVIKDYEAGKGLYRQHCAHCHGVTGDGYGPTAKFLNPYPRDFRMGTFKFKSTPVGYRPTDDDLTRIVRNGINGTAMPSFKEMLDSGQIDAIVDYVKYLALRGQTERSLISLSGDYGYETPEETTETQAELLSKEVLVDEILGAIVEEWTSASETATEAEGRDPVYDFSSPEFDQSELDESIARGQQLYYGAGACVTCHGPTQLGDGQTTDYDNWTKDFFGEAAKVADAELLDAYLTAGGLPPRNIIPRNLRQGVYRGGRRPIDIYWRVKNGIDGTPMPAASSQLTDDDVWDIVNFVLSVPYQSLSQPADMPEFVRDRN
ncbi:MAG: c-type cytochrome [Planctomycetales bacterium]|nr:c-type cytochrome [Planctomycetales bacterium]